VRNPLGQDKLPRIKQKWRMTAACINLLKQAHEPKLAYLTNRETKAAAEFCELHLRYLC